MGKKSVIDTSKNLIPVNKRTKEEQREITRKGGIRSGEVRRQKKMMKDAMKDLLKLPVRDNELKAEMKELGIEEKEMDNQLALLVSAYKRGLEGNVKAMEFIRDTIGEKPKEEIEIKEVPNIVDDIPRKDGRS